MIKPFPPHDELLPCPPPEDFVDDTFHSADGYKLDIRIWPSPNSNSSSPWILWCHGGAFCAGSHCAPPSWVIPALRARGFHIVSCAYRLAPAVQMKSMLSDITDAYSWCRENLPRVLDGVDVDRAAIGGDSAGGFLALYLGMELHPIPKAVISCYGPADFTIPPPSFDKEEETWEDRWKDQYSAEENDAILSGAKKGEVSTMCPFIFEIRNVSLEETRKRWRLPTLEYDGAVRFQTQLGDYMGFKGAMRKSVFGMRGDEEPEERMKIMKGWSPKWRLAEKSTYPPTAFLHGEEDEIVPVEHARRMANEVKGKGVEVWEAFVPEMPHAFDMVFTVSVRLMELISGPLG